MKKIQTFSIFLFSILLIACLTTSCKKETNTKPTPVVDSLGIGLVAYYPFNGNINDVSGNNNNGTRSITTIGSNYITFYGYDNILVPDTEPIRLVNTDFTLSAWTQIDPSANISTIASKHIKEIGTGWVFGIQATSTSSRVFYKAGEGAGKMAIGNTGLYNPKWNMLTCVYNSANKSLSLYVNGVLDNTTSNIPSPDDSANIPLFIGTDVSAKSSTGNSYTLSNIYYGNMDDLRIYNIKLSTAEVKKLYQQSQPF